MEFRTGRALRKASLAGALLACGGAAAAEGGGGFELPRVSLTPIAGYTFSGEFEDEAGVASVEVEDAAHYGLILDMRESAHTQWEVFYALQETEADTSELPGSAAGATDLDIQYLQVGGTYVADGLRARPFLAAAVGVTRFDPDPLTFDSENFFSFGVGAGWQLQPMERLGLRLEGRLLGTFLGSDTDLFCQTGPDDNVCAISVDGDTYWQFQTSLGLIFRF
ncbi:MAG TPA: hypothetical protein VE175_08825 [Woeseiaceae bacterium]|nr:hypothetical protein [Woeseiaceae bacterium]